MPYYDWKPYVPVAVRRKRAAKKMQALRKKGTHIQPIEIEGRKIVTTFWGEAWCEHLESFSDFENRLPRGRTYVRNGSVCHLAVNKGRVEAKVSGSEIYNVKVRIKTLPAPRWTATKKKCAGQIGSLIELLQGNLSDNVMQVVTDRKQGLFPRPGEMTFECDCPDWAGMCKHVAAVLYGIGARLDNKPELLFHLRGVNHDELVSTDADISVTTKKRKGKTKHIASEDLSDVFGIEVSGPATEPPRKRKAKKKTAPKSGSTATAKKKKASPSRSPKKKRVKKTTKKKATKKKRLSRVS